MIKMSYEDELNRLNKLEGKQLDAYHDGKSSPSRLVRVVVESVFHRGEFSRKGRALWHSAIKKDFKDVFESCIHYIGRGDVETKQFWDWNCEVFISGHILYDDETIKDTMLFAKRVGGGWYGVNWNYSLDLEGKIRRKMLPTWKKCADEQGLRMEWDPDAGKYKYFNKKTGLPVDR